VFFRMHLSRSIAAVGRGCEVLSVENGFQNRRDVSGIRVRRHLMRRSMKYTPNFFALIFVVFLLHYARNLWRGRAGREAE
jgi:hypothetical protein